MLKHKLRIISLLCTAALTMTSAIIPAIAEEGTQDLDPTIEFDTDPSVFATVEFGREIHSHNMEFIDGLAGGNVPEADDPIYSEYFEMDGRTGRKVYKQNYIYAKLDKDFYQEGDSRFFIYITFYDFGPSQGYYHFEYSSSDTTLDEEARKHKRISVLKPGTNPGWLVTKLYVDDADFGGKMDFESDMRLCSNAYNAFTQIQVINVDAARRAEGVVKMRSVNMEKAQQLANLGGYTIGEGELEDSLQRTITRYEMLEMSLKATGKLSLAQKNGGETSFTDISDEQKAVVGYAEQRGYINGNGSGLFRPDDIATQREFITFYMRLLSLADENTYSDALNQAEAHYLAMGEDLVVTPDSHLTHDNFVAVALNALTVEMPTGSSIGRDMVKSGAVNEEQVKGSLLEGYMYEDGYDCPPVKIVDGGSGREYYYMNMNGTPAINQYVAHQHFHNGEPKFLIGTNTATGGMYEYNMETHKLKKLADAARSGGSLMAYITPENVIFYQANVGGVVTVRRYDWKTGEDTHVIDIPGNVEISNITTTNDGKYMSMNWMRAENESDYFNGSRVNHLVVRINVEKGEVDYLADHGVFTETPDHPGGGHYHINPTDENILSYCHEGTTQYIHDRIMYHDIRTGKNFNQFVQSRIKGDPIRTGETTGHELWSTDGEWQYFVKYPFDQNVGFEGPARVSKDGTEREYFADDTYRYWHCHPSADHNWIVADTQLGNSSQIVLINTKTYEAQVLCQFDTPQSPQHPYQPHPVISRDGKYVNWQLVHDGVLGVGYMDISDITQNPTIQTREEMGEGVKIINTPYEETPYSLEKLSDDEGEYYKVSRLKNMYFDVDEFHPGTEAKKLKIKFKYLDNGRQPFYVGYTSYIADEYEWHEREDKSVKVMRNGTNKWLTTEVELSDVSLANACKYRSDFYMTAKFSKLCIKDVEVSVE